MNYRQWLDGGCGCNVNINCCGDINPCDCDEILLEISNLHTDDAVLQEEIDDLSGEVETKLDASAYTPVDLSDYYTKEQSDAKFLTEHQPLKTINGESLVGEGNIVISGGSGTTIDAYTKQESDAKYALKTEIPSLSGYATEQWVLDKHYITGVDLSSYATENWVNTNYQPKGNYLTEHQPIKTINGESLVGEGNIVISGDTDLSNYYNKTEVDNIITSAITDVEAEIPSLSGYATEQWVLDKNYITGVDLSNYALKSEIPTVPTSNSAFTNDMHYVTSADAITEIVGNVYAGQGSYGITYTKNGTTTNKLIFGIGNGLKVGSITSTIEVDTSKIPTKTELTNNYYTKTEVNNLLSNKIWCGTQAQYDALATKENDVLYLIHA